MGPRRQKGPPLNPPEGPWWLSQRTAMTGCAAPGRRNSVLWGAGTQGVAVGRPGSLGLSEETVD